MIVKQEKSLEYNYSLGGNSASGSYSVSASKVDLQSQYRPSWLGYLDLISCVKQRKVWIMYMYNMYIYMHLQYELHVVHLLLQRILASSPFCHGLMFWPPSFADVRHPSMTLHRSATSRTSHRACTSSHRWQDEDQQTHEGSLEAAGLRMERTGSNGSGLVHAELGDVHSGGSRKGDQGSDLQISSLNYIAMFETHSYLAAHLWDLTARGHQRALNSTSRLLCSWGADSQRRNQ